MAKHKTTMNVEIVTDGKYCHHLCNCFEILNNLFGLCHFFKTRIHSDNCYFKRCPRCFDTFIDGIEEIVEQFVKDLKKEFPFVSFQIEPQDDG